MNIPVQKYHGCGNDFILVDAADVESLTDEQKRKLVIDVCDRHMGIGADGCIFVARDPLEMIYYNQDGSRADMCGNGLRCFSRYVRENGLVDSDSFSVVTLAGTRDVDLLDPNFECIRLNLGKPEFSTEKMQLDLEEFPDPLVLDLDGKKVTLHCVYMNTMHTVLFVEDAFDESLAEIGRAVENHPLFRDRTNVNFVEIVDGSHIRASTWERGCGMTLACATGMAASAVESVLQKGLDRKIHVTMKKGALELEITSDGSVLLTGPARRVLKGEYLYEPQAS